MRLDHVVIAVPDLETASARLRDTLGFSLKPGREHANGLRNVHVRFADGSALELITVGRGEPDDLSAWYTSFLGEGEGGAFVALRAGPAASVLRRLGDLAADAQTYEGPAFDWVSFPAEHPLHSVFFVHVRSRPPDTADHIHHANGAAALEQVWLESPRPSMLAALLERFGAFPCGEVRTLAGLAGVAFGLSGGSLVAVPALSGGREPRIVSVLLRGDRTTPSASSAGVRIDWVRADP